MKLTFENCWMILPNRTVGFGDLETDGACISRITLRDPSDFNPNTQTPKHPNTSPSRLILPGLINCHGHTAMTLVRGLGGGLPLQRWLEEAIFPVEAKMTPADVAAGTAWGVREMLAGGTTAVADMYDFPAACAESFAAAGFKARVNRVGLSFISGRLEECISFTRDFNRSSTVPLAHRASACLRQLGSASADSSRANGKSSMSPVDDSNPNPQTPKHPNTVLADLCIHSEYLTDEPFCRALAAANNAELKRPLHVHVSETEKEHRECIERHGKTPIAYLAETGLLDQGGYAAHCVWCTDDDFRIMAEKGVSLIHNPTSNMKLGSGFARIPRAMELGVNVALGTDGCASNDNLDMFEEMHLASLIHKGLAKDPTVLSAWDVIEMATVNGAKALGMSDAGELAVGKAADLCVVDLDRSHLTPCLDIPSLVVNSMHASDVVMTVVDGVVRYEKGADDPTLAAAKSAFLSSVRNIGLNPLWCD